MADNQGGLDAEIVERLDRIADLMALTLVRGLEQDEQIRILSAAGYAPARIGSLLGIRPNTVSVTLSRARRKAASTKKRPRSRGGN